MIELPENLPMGKKAVETLANHCSRGSSGSCSKRAGPVGRDRVGDYVSVSYTLQEFWLSRQAS
jgi:hypothetical protein